MKKFVFPTVLLFSFTLSTQNQYDESESLSDMDIGVYYQNGPGTNNALNWTYPYGTKLSVIGGSFRNFEITTTVYPYGEPKLRQWDPSLSQWTEWRRILMEDENGNAGIGTTNPDAKLTVKGNIHAEEVKVDLAVPGPDYVFKEDYHLITPEALQNYIKANGHLPNIPSAKDMEENGIELSTMNMKLLEKI